MLMLRLRLEGHQGSEAEAFSDVQREKTRDAASVSPLREAGSAELGSSAK